VPKQTGSGGRVKLLGISKRGDGYLRTLLIHGARRGKSACQRAGAMVGADQGSPPLQCGVCSAGGQNGQNDLGRNRQGAGLPQRLQKRQATSGVKSKSIRKDKTT